VDEDEDWTLPLAAIDAAVQPLSDVVPVALPSSLHSVTTRSVESPGPAIKPSRDIVMCQITLLAAGNDAPVAPCLGHFKPTQGMSWHSQAVVTQPSADGGLGPLCSQS
jgi:hypothetical protein